ncbi:MAG: MFS transporter [Pseudomonadales bacterium]|nr:MFS transporter [Pseudomonadales bacterium]
MTASESELETSTQTSATDTSATDTSATDTSATATAAVAEDDYPGLGSASYCLGLLFSAYILSFIDRQILALLVGPIRADFGITDFEYSLLAGAAFAILYAVAGLPLGRLADKYSRRMIVAGSVFFWSIMTVSCGFTKNFAQLFVARMGVGAGEAGLSPPAYSLILDSFRPQHVGFAMSFYKLGVKIGGGLALVVGGFLYDYYASLGVIELAYIGVIKPWQATIISVGLPGMLLSLLFLTIQEPTRKGLIAKNGEVPTEIPFKEVVDFIWQRRRTYLCLLLGSSMMAMAQYGSGAWYPELFTRNYGMSKSEAGASFGIIILVAGSAGIMLATWCASLLRKRGYEDANVRTMFFASVLAIPFSTLAPLSGEAQTTLWLLWPAVLLSGSYLGLMAVSIVEITPNQMRGQVTAVYIFSTSMIGMALGGSVLAAFTDFLYQDDNLLHYSIATACILFYPVAAGLFWYCLPAYTKSLAEAKRWSQ